MDRGDKALSKALKSLGERYPRYGYLMLHAMLRRDGHVLNIVGDYSRVCVGQVVDTSISGQRMANHLDVLKLQRGLPRSIVMDNGPEMTSKAMFFWSQASGVKLNFIQPGKPTQNAYVESFNGKFIDGCLNQHWFKDLKEAREIIEARRNHYNQERPHSSLGYTLPARFEKRVA